MAIGALRALKGHGEWDPFDVCRLAPIPLAPDRVLEDLVVDPPHHARIEPQSLAVVSPMRQQRSFPRGVAQGVFGVALGIRDVPREPDALTERVEDDLVEVVQ